MTELPTTKKLRKGTRSCFECNQLSLSPDCLKWIANGAFTGRQRKIRCTFRPNNTTTCIGCFSHGIPCVSQDDALTAAPSHAHRMNLSERVALIEQQLASMYSDHLPTSEPPLRPRKTRDDDASSNSQPRSAVLGTEPTRVAAGIQAVPAPGENFPALSLFDNAILASDTKNAFNHFIHGEFNGEYHRAPNIESGLHFQRSRLKRAKVCEALTYLLPPHTAIYAILEAGGYWWDILRNMYPYLCSEDPHMTVQAYVVSALNQDNPATMACALSWIVLSMQCLPLDFDTQNLGLPLCVDELMEQYTENIERLVVSDDELSLSIEGIDSILLQTQFYANLGRPRKAWTTLRRGLSHAVMLGLHQISVPAEGTCPARVQRREGVWWHLVECDSYLSLLMGLPSFAAGGAYNIGRHQRKDDSQTTTQHYRKKLAIIVGRISHRNQGDPAQLPSSTDSIAEELHALAGLMPPQWWQLDPPSSSSLNEGILELHERMGAQFCHYQAQVYLHLPLMLQSPANERYDNNSAKCLAGSRKMIQIYVQMREYARGKINICRVMDFQTFTAAVIVILGLLGYGPRRLEQDQHQQVLDDWALIDKTVEVLGRVRCERENLVAAQCLQALDQLITIGRGSVPAEQWKCRIFVPFFGMLSVLPGIKYGDVPMTTLPPHPANPSRSVITGGQGSNQDAMQAIDTTMLLQPEHTLDGPVIGIDVFNTPFLGSFAPNPQYLPSAMVGPEEFPFQDPLAMDIDQDWRRIADQFY